MEWLITNSIAAWLLPPGFVLVVLLAAMLLAPRRPRLSRSLAVLSFFSLYALSTPFVANQLRQWLEPAPRDPLSDKSGEAIVVLGGGVYMNAPEYGGDTVSASSLPRLRYAARLQRALKKPVLVTGGPSAGGGTAEATLMKAVLMQEFLVPVQWSEEHSRTTLENARLSARLLKETGIRRIYLVTHAWHMPRSILAFERSGFTIIPAPTDYVINHELTLLDFLPSADALLNSSRVFHEVIGIGWYHLRILLGR